MHLCYSLSIMSCERLIDDYIIQLAFTTELDLTCTIQLYLNNRLTYITQVRSLRSLFSYIKTLNGNIMR